MPILYIDSDDFVGRRFKATLELEGWDVELCTSSLVALNKINGYQHYDLIILELELDGVSGINLIRYARSLAHRRLTPLVMFTSYECEEEAFEAGASIFLRKPEDINDIADVIKLLRPFSDYENSIKKTALPPQK